MVDVTVSCGTHSSLRTVTAMVQSLAGTMYHGFLQKHTCTDEFRKASRRGDLTHVSLSAYSFSVILANYDPFQRKKQDSYHVSTVAIAGLANYITGLPKTVECSEELEAMLQVSDVPVD